MFPVMLNNIFFLEHIGELRINILRRKTMSGSTLRPLHRLFFKKKNLEKQPQLHPPYITQLQKLNL
jgi:hypothetical protein